MTKQELFHKADYYKNLIDTNRPIHAKQQKEIDHYFRMEFIYRSNLLEGNTLTIAETKQIFEEGITAAGKHRKEYDEAIGQAEAYDYILSLAGTEQLEITETIIQRLHYLLYYKMDYEEAGQYRRTQVSISGTEHMPPKAEDVPHLMEHFMNQMQSSKRLLHPIEFAAMCYKRLVDIEPFGEGNGKVARLLMNVILVNAGYGITSIPPELRYEYSNALVLSQRKNNPNIDTFVDLITECVIEAGRDYCRLLGETD